MTTALVESLFSQLPQPYTKVTTLLDLGNALTRAHWRSLYGNLKQNPELYTWDPSVLIDTLLKRPHDLATAEVQRRRQQQKRKRTPTGKSCPSCKQRSLQVSFIRRSTGPGHKCEEVCVKQCESCNYRQTS